MLNSILNFDFSKSYPCKVKIENHQNSMCDSSKEPYGFTDHKSEKKTKKYWYLTDLWAKTCFKKTLTDSDYFHWKKEFAIHLVKYQYFFNFSSDLWSVSQCGSFELSHIEFWWFKFFAYISQETENRPPLNYVYDIGIFTAERFQIANMKPLNQCIKLNVPNKNKGLKCCSPPWRTLLKLSCTRQPWTRVRR